MEGLFPHSLKGNFLMAMPHLADPNFAQTVTCICEHSDKGAVGIIINRVHFALSAKDIFDELNIPYAPMFGEMPVHIGGPVHIDEIFILHGPPFDWKGCLVVTPFLGMSNTRDILEAVALGEGPHHAMIVLGCSGWGPAQLEWEIKENAWLISPISHDIIFDVSVESKWELAVKKIGIDRYFLTEKAGHA